MAVMLGVFGSFCFALSAKVQHSAVGGQVEENRARQRMDRRQLLQLLQDTHWWIGMGLMGVSLACQVCGLTMAPVSVVQPVGLLAFPWSVILAGKLRGPGATRILVPTVLTVAAAFGFVAVVAAHTSPSKGLSLIPVAIASCVVYAVAGLFASAGSRGPRQWRCLFWASGGALFYGLEASLVKAVIEYARDHAWWQDPMVWGIGVALVIGSGLAGLLVQQGYATGPTEVVVASMTVTSPVVAVIFGIAVLGEGRHLTFGPAFCLVGLGLAAIAGVIMLTRAHPTYRAAKVAERGDGQEHTEFLDVG
ncbi:MAG: hypothetical protein LBR32_08280 [Propionibacteriaceae bacterium]|jgi:hypothetical protein|nr:hypothetical protein [Propionibacteriaceae bacterium]